MPALLNFDCEFTSSVPRLGALLHIGMAVHPFNPNTLESSGPLVTHQAYFKLPDAVEITDWVQENQSDLLKRCSEISYEEDTKAKLGCLTFLKEQKAKHDLLIPAGYVLGSDTAYLYDLLGKDHELVHYAGLDLKSIGTVLYQDFDFGDENLAKELKISKNKNEHNALSDALFQAKLMLASLALIKSKPVQLGKQKSK